jgi:hypothetical protein
MGMIKGDKSRFNRERRKKLARRVEMRALRATLAAKSVAPPPAKAAAARPARRKAPPSPV